MRVLELGVHETEMTIEVEIRSGHKEVLDVRSFIRGLCEYYEIPIVQEEPPKSPRRTK